MEELIGRSLLTIGIIIAAVGGAFLLAGKIPFIGKLPGDIVIKRENFSFYFPIATSILLSLIITAIIWLIGRK